MDCAKRIWKDEYFKELTEILKDVRTHSELYAKKTRILLNNLLRDELAALFLIGFSIFGKLGSNLEELNPEVIKVVFRGLAIYLIASLILQTMVHTTDLMISRKELSYWKNITRGYMSNVEMESHIKKPLKGRRIILIIMSIVLGLTYIALAFTSWNFPQILKSLKLM